MLGKLFAKPKQLIKNHILSKHHKISKNSTVGAQRLDFDDFLGPFGHPFFFKLSDHPNLLNCSTDNITTLLLQFEGSHFGIEHPLKLIIFQGAIQDPIFF